MPSLKSHKSTKSRKSRKTREDEIESQRQVSDRRMVKYDGPKHTKSEVKLRKNALYDLLDIPTTSTQSEIKKAYRQKALELHPDKNREGNQEDLNEQLGQVNRAYKILSDPTKRKIYDQYGIDAVQTFEENEISPSWLWFVYSRFGRVVTCVILVLTCCCCCFCCCACCFDCFCGCCCNRCCKSKNKDHEEDGYMAYDPEAARSPPPPKSKISTLINTISSKKVIKKKKKNGEGESNVVGENGQTTSIRTQPPSQMAQSQKEKKMPLTQTTQEVTNEEANNE